MTVTIIIYIKKGHRPPSSMPKTVRLLLLQTAILLCCSVTPAQNISGKIVYADNPGRIQIINADGTGQTQLTEGGSLIDDEPVYSPDGSRIAFSRQSGFKTDICIMNANGTNVVTVISSDAALESHNRKPSWSPDGTKIVFTSNRSGSGKTEIWMANTDGSGLLRLTTSIQRGSDGNGPIFSLDFGPAWSPDGSKIVFVSNREGADTELYVMNPDGSNLLRLTDDSLDDTLPAWSPDSQRIVFTKNNGGGTHIINRDGTNLVFFMSFAAWPAWSPDGSRLAFTQSDSTIPFTSNIYTAKTDGTDKIQVTNNPNGARAPSWAPGSSSPIPTFTISGQVKDTNGAAISGATLTIFQIPIRTTQSDAAGNYSFTGLAAGTYKVDVAKSGYGFISTSITLTNINSNQTANFTGFVAFTISGQVSGGGSGVPVTLSGSQSRSVFTEHDGVYSFTVVPAGGNYTVAVNSPFFNITPPSITFNNLSADQVANFNAVRATYTISGTVTRLGAPKAGLTMWLREPGDAPLATTTDANGHYAFTNIVAGRSYSVEPIGANYLAQSREYPALDGNKIADFALLSANHLLFSNATFTVVEGVPSLRIFVHRGGNAAGVGPITVDYATVNGTAEAGLDYTAVSGTLDFPEGSFSKTITIPILSDQFYEGPEQFTIFLSNPTGEVDLAAPSSAVVTIGEVRLITAGAGDDRAIALNATSLVAEPFSLTTDSNFSADQRTRISLFVEDLRVFPTFPSIVIDAVDVQQNHFQLPLEVVAFYSIFPFQQLVVRLPENLNTPLLFVTVKVNGSATNTARIAIKQ